MVKLGCERTMGRYGYPWPKMLDCANFPADNDMCIRFGHTWEKVARVHATYRQVYKRSIQDILS